MLCVRMSRSVVWLRKKVSAAKEQSAILQKAAIDEQQRFEVIAKALDALRQERSLLLKGKSADEKAAVAPEEKKN